MASATAPLSLQDNPKAARLKLALYRPHANIWFRSTVGMVLKRNMLPNKYAPFLDYLLRSDIEVSFTSCFLDGVRPIAMLRWLFDCFELILWCALHQLSLKNVQFIFRTKSLSNKDVLFLMHYGNFAFEAENATQNGMALAKSIGELDLKKVVHLTHYAYSPQSGAKNLAAVRAHVLIAENNLRKNSAFYAKYFSALPGNFLCVPYTPADRFQNRKAFDLRINKLVVTGSITYKMKSKEFIDFFDVDELQPMRRKLYEKAASYREQMDCLIFDLDASRKNDANTTLLHFSSMLNKTFDMKPQRGYYKKDIVDVYNSYKMFAVPEEVCDLPAIGFVEGMACGAAYIGLANPMYSDLGLLPNVHYIEYDGSVTDLMTKVEYYQKRPIELERIAHEGCLLVRRNLATNRVYGRFLDQLKAIAFEANDAKS